MIINQTSIIKLIMVINVNSDGWVSIDFMVASMIILLIIPGIVAISEDRVNTANSVNEIAKAKVLSDNLAETIEMVYSGGDGCSIIFKMPANIEDKPYYINVNSSGVYVRFHGMINSAFINPMMISYSLKKSRSNVLMQPNKLYNISNIKDEYGYTHIIIKRT